MVSPKVAAASDHEEAFPAADAVGELYPGKAQDFSVDPVSSKLKEQAEWEEKKKTKMENEEKGRNDGVSSLKSTIIITGVVVALIGAVFAISKKLREK